MEAKNWNTSRDTTTLYAQDRYVFRFLGQPDRGGSGGGEKHALIMTHQMRLLFGCFEPLSLPTGINAPARDFSDGQVTSPALPERIDRAIAQFPPFR